MANGWTWDIDPPVRRAFLSLPEPAQDALVELLEGIVGDDPLGIRQAAAEADPGGVTRSLAFGKGSGLVTVLIIVRGKHVQVIQITWAGEG